MSSGLVQIARDSQGCSGWATALSRSLFGMSDWAGGGAGGTFGGWIQPGAGRSGTSVSLLRDPGRRYFDTIPTTCMCPLSWSFSHQQWRQCWPYAACAIHGDATIIALLAAEAEEC